MAQAIAIARTNEISHEQWLEERRKGIGGSDAAVILGLNPYVSRFKLYAEKKGLLVDFPDNEAMRQGRDLEAYVAERFTEETGMKVRRENSILQHPENPWMLANIDRRIVGQNAGLECKTTTVMNKSRFDKGDIPDAYYVQCVHYMAVTGAEKWYLAVMVLGRAFHWFEIKRDENEIMTLINAERDFWENYILKDNPPDPDGEETTTKVINDLFPASKVVDDNSIPLFGLEAGLEAIKSIDENIKELEKQKALHQQKIQLALGDCERGQGRDGWSVSWKKQRKETVDNKELKEKYPDIFKACLKLSEYRVFRIKKEEITI